MQRLNEGIAGWVNPFGQQKYLVSLKREDVRAFAFWSKNYRPFLPAVREVKKQGFPCLFNYTITGLPQVFECDVVPLEDSLDSLKALSRLFTPNHISWRYDPIVVSNQTGSRYHLEQFEYLASRLAGFTTRCYVSYAVFYEKVKRNYLPFSEKTGVNFIDPKPADKIKLAEKLAAIARKYAIQLYTCCGDYLVSNTIKKAHCIDADVLSSLYYSGLWKGRERPTRPECGCTENTDIGSYDTCPHGCIYCYANSNKQRAMAAYAKHDVNSLFLGYSKAQSDAFVKTAKPPAQSAGSATQLQLKF